MKPTASQVALVTLIACSGALWALTRGTALAAPALTGLGLALIAGALLAERLWPERAEWNRDQGDLGGDLFSFVMVVGVLEPLLKWVLPLVLLALMPGSAGGLSALPLWQQIVLATLLIELAAWGSHLAHHRLRWLWALHFVHHAPGRLHVLNNFRFHPLNYALNAALMALPVAVLGLSPEAVTAYGALALPVLIVQHANLATDFGRLNGLFNTNEVHVFHHSADPQEGNMNLGRALVIWDRAFGTYMAPGGRPAPRRLGLFADGRGYPGPRHLLAQFAYPFSRACCPGG